LAADQQIGAFPLVFVALPLGGQLGFELFDPRL
jgi:hypothetical protein